jgi:hypothetical protein
MAKRRPKGQPEAGGPPDSKEPRCGLCGKAGNLTKTECCGNWICDDEDQYVLFSYAHNSCHRNHSRYTLCAYHFNEGHDGTWQECPKCRDEFEPEMYVYYVTNDYNFEKLPNPPSYEPTLCRRCGRVIRLAEDGYILSAQGYTCYACEYPAQARRAPKRKAAPKKKPAAGRKSAPKAKPAPKRKRPRG